VQAAVAERSQGLLLRARTDPCAHGGARTLQAAVDRRDRGLQHRCDLTRAEAHHLAQDEHRALRRGEVLQRGDERQLQPFTLLIARFGIHAPRPDAHRFARIRFDPRRLDLRHAGRRMRRGGRTELVRQHALAPPFEFGQADVGRDGVEPRASRTRIAQAGGAAPGAQQHILQRVIGIVHRAEQPVTVRMELGPVTFDEIRKVRPLVRSRLAQDFCSTTSNVCPLGSRNQNIGGTGSPMRETS
jgi:hypothetical protein